MLIAIYKYTINLKEVIKCNVNKKDIRLNGMRDDVIKGAIDSGIKKFSVNAVCQNDWHDVILHN